MTQLILSIPDNRLKFFIEQISHFDFIQNIYIPKKTISSQEKIYS